MPVPASATSVPPSCEQSGDLPGEAPLAGARFEALERSRERATGRERGVHASDQRWNGGTTRVDAVTTSGRDFVAFRQLRIERELRAERHHVGPHRAGRAPRPRARRARAR